MQREVGLPIEWVPAQGGRYAASVCHGQGWSVALHQTEQPLLKGTMVVPQTYMAASRTGWDRTEAVNSARRPFHRIGLQSPLAAREDMTRDRTHWSRGVAVLCDGQSDIWDKSRALQFCA